MEPIDYTSAFSNIPSPQSAMVEGMKLGGAMRAQQQAREDAEKAKIAQAQMNADLHDLSQNPTTEMIGRMSLKYPQLSENFKRSFDILEPGQKQQKLEHASQVYSAISNGKPEIAVDLLTKQAAGLRNSGNEKDAKAAEIMASMVRDHPDMAKASAGLILSSAVGPEKFAATYGAIGGEQRAAEQAPADLAIKKAKATTDDMGARVAVATAPEVVEKAALTNADLRSQIDDRAKRFGLDQDKFQTETQLKMDELQQKHGVLPEFVAKDVNTAATEAIAARQSGQRMTDLAAQLEVQRDALGSGATAKVGEFWKNTFGSQNELSRLRSEYTRIVTPAALGAYKQVTSGTTSDRDIETAMKGVPPDTASPDQMISFLKGTAKLQKYDELLQNAKSEWLANVRSLTKAKTDTEIDGVQVPAGMSFKQFTDQYLARKVNQETVQSRGYMKYNVAPQTGGASGDY